ncbi:MAG: FHA domain-containing protein [Anaerolineales bacterium]|nr:FHA domain-containing protein [Anaerolineales bacterium]MBS3751813.1 FHA domain-containing protein [Anaerolineales bacterium]
MITCKVCKNQEYIGAIFCSECGSAFLAEHHLDDDTVVYPRKEGDPNYRDIPHPEKSIPKGKIALYLPDYETYLDLPEENEFTLGRLIEGQVITPEVDLDPYDGFENGISRLHATIRMNPKKNSIQVLDLGSANGTRVNGYEIPANSEVPLTHEDILTLGKLHLKVIIPEKYRS